MDAQVAIVGADPTGLMLACELALAGVRATVLERAAEPGNQPKANGLVGHIVRVFDARGLLDGAPDLRPVTPPRFPFGPISLELHRLPDNPLHVLPIPQQRLEELLTARAVELGVTIQRGNDVVGFDVKPGCVSLRIRTTAGTDDLTASYVVGCDGARSFVRQHAGLVFPGTTSDETSRIGRVVLPAAAIQIEGDVIMVRNGPQLNMFRPNQTPSGAITIAPVAALDPTARNDSSWSARGSGAGRRMRTAPSPSPTSKPAFNGCWAPGCRSNTPSGCGRLSRTAVRPRPIGRTGCSWPVMRRTSSRRAGRH